jgi:predicted nuclease with TOPRIM domain
MEVDPDQIEVGGTPVGSIGAVEQRQMPNGSSVAYVDYPLEGADGTIKLLRFKPSDKISLQEMVARINKKRMLDTILTGTAGYQEIQDDLEDAIRQINRDIEEWKHMTDTYSAALKAGELSPAQLDQLKAMIPILNEGIKNREDELRQLTTQKSIVDAALVTTSTQ